jgi:hypothetical protein
VLRAIVFGMEVARESDERSQPDAASQRAPVGGSNPFEDRPGTNVGVFLRGGERSEVTEDTLGVSEPKTEGPAPGEVGINGRVQHDGTCGQGWATGASSCRSTLA